MGRFGQKVTVNNAASFIYLLLISLDPIILQSLLLVQLFALLMGFFDDSFVLKFPDVSVCQKTTSFHLLFDDY